jgi:hypothetical protein
MMCTLCLATVEQRSVGGGSIEGRKKKGRGKEGGGG